MTRLPRARRPRSFALVAALTLLAAMAGRADTSAPITLRDDEGDYAGTTIGSEDGRRVLGFIAYRQQRAGDILRRSPQLRRPDDPTAVRCSIPVSFYTRRAHLLPAAPPATRGLPSAPEWHRSC